MAAPPTRGALTIGAVLDLLKADFPDVTISKIRFLETEGLIRPGRSPSGYRAFASTDVDRLRYILRAQRDRFWPLKVIRESLDALDRGLQPPKEAGRPFVPAPSADPLVPTGADLAAAAAPLRLTRAELGSASGLDAATLEALIGYGLLDADADGHFGASALPVAAAAARLASYGMEARHLRPFRNAADREVGLIQQVVPPRRGRGGNHERERADLLAQCIALHVALVRARLGS